MIEKDGKFFVSIPTDGLPKKKSMPLSKRDPNNKTHFVIIGGGPAGLNCAETLRQSGFTGQITVLSREEAVPYDRTLLSKALGSGDPSKWTLRPEDYLKDADIDYKLKSGVFAVNTEVKKVITVQGKHIYYDKLLIASGSNVWAPPVKGLERDRRGNVTPKNVFFLRTDKDQQAIKEACAKAKKVVIIGASFIGSECASSLKGQFKDEIEIDVINAENTPFERTLGKQVGEFLAA